MKHLGAKLAAGDQAAFAELYRAFGDRLHHYLAARLGSRPDADDVLQETFVRLARNRYKLRDVENLAAYVFTIARNEARRFAERKQREAARGRSLSATDLFDEACSKDLARRELAEQVAGALDGLSAEQREVVELKTYGGLTFREIAEVTGAPQGTVVTRYRAALASLRRLLAEEDP
jgi:RNA polymerase sigma-70 factor (ECF subfamily)